MKRSQRTVETVDWKQILSVDDVIVQGDNTDVLKTLPAGFIDLIYIDPPFGTDKVRADNTSSEVRYADVWDSDEAYLDWLFCRLELMWPLLTDRGSIFIHLDQRFSHYVKVGMDKRFGRDRFVNEIIWHYTGGGRSKSRFSNKHDIILWYARSVDFIFHRDAVRVPYVETSGYAQSGIIAKSGKRYLPHPDGTPVDDVWNIPMVNPMSKDRTGYPTQKPLALLERIISAASDPDSLVADFFLGSGTSAVAARRLKRRFLGCDLNPDSITIALERCKSLSKRSIQTIHYALK